MITINFCQKYKLFTGNHVTGNLCWKSNKTKTRQFVYIYTYNLHTFLWAAELKISFDTRMSADIHGARNGKNCSSRVSPLVHRRLYYLSISYFHQVHERSSHSAANTTSFVQCSSTMCRFHHGKVCCPNGRTRKIRTCLIEIIMYTFLNCWSMVTKSVYGFNRLYTRTKSGL